jgi:hypothetical protein
MTPIILAALAACSTPPINGKMTHDCVVATCPNAAKFISDSVSQNSKTKLSADGWTELGQTFIWYLENCKSVG